MESIVNEAGNDGGSITVGLPLVDCARHLARLWPTMPLEKRSPVLKLRNQILSWDRGGNRDGLRKEIPRTIAEIERTEIYAEEN